MKKNCKVEYKVVPNNSLETTRNFLIANQVIDRFNSIINLNNFRLAVTELTENARKLGYFPNRIIREDQNGKKAIFDIPSFKKIDGIKAQQEKIANRQPTLFQLPENQVNYILKSANALQSDKVRNPKNNLQGFYNDLQKQGVPNQQIEIIKSLNPEGKTKEELLTELLANYSYTVEINTAKNKIGSTIHGKGLTPKLITKENVEWAENLFGGKEGQYWVEYITDDGDPDLRVFNSLEEANKAIETERSKDLSSVYSNLTVPGGTNYTENEISTPLITPSIKGHAQFSTDNGIGWFRSDEQINEVGWTGNWEDGEGITSQFDNKTRRILELQSDLFQKGRESEDLLTKNNDYKENLTGMPVKLYPNKKIGDFIEKDGYRYEIKRIEKDDDGFNEVQDIYVVEYVGQAISKEFASKNQFLQLLNKDSNWVKFFVKSIIQDTAKQTVTEVQESDVEAKVRELENSGLLKIKCD